MIHNLKIEKRYLKRLSLREKTFEIRKNDRDFQVGDDLSFEPEDDGTGDNTNLVFNYRVNYISDYEQKEGYVAMAVTPCQDAQEANGVET